jgi:phospholipid-translocating ATPase
MQKGTQNLNVSNDQSRNNYEEFLDETQEEIIPSNQNIEKQMSYQSGYESKHPSLEKPKRSFCEKNCTGSFQRVSTKPREIFNDGEVFPYSRSSNKVNNCKYNIFFFLPIFLWDQYKYFGNLYFLLLAITQFFDRLKVGFMITYIGPIIFILGFSLAKEIWDHYNTWKKDEEYNREKFMVFRGGKWKYIDSKNIKVGDLIKLKKKQRVPADMIFMGNINRKLNHIPSVQYSNIGSEYSLNQTQNEDLIQGNESISSTFVTTDQLDGETDLKPRQSLKFTSQLLNKGESMLKGTIWKMKIEPPNEQIYSFKGQLEYEGGREVVKLNNTLWMGMKVTTHGVVGMVIFNGKETKMALNSRKKTSKMGKTDMEIDRIILILFFILTTISLLITILSGNLNGWDTFFYLLRILILLSSIIPISMRVLIDFAKIYYCIEIKKDKDLIQTVTRNSGLPEELARVEYLLSDKTGTLTRNEMIFQQFVTRHINVKFNDFGNLKQFLKGKNSQKSSNLDKAFVNKDSQKQYPFEGSDLISEGSSRYSVSSRRIDSAQNLFDQFKDKDMDSHLNSHQNIFDKNNLSKSDAKEHLEQQILGFLLCNNVKVSKDEQGETIIQGASPDELCIVDFARDLGYEIVSRSKHHLKLCNLQNVQIKYTILKEFAFSSELKRMGMLVTKSVRPGSGTNHGDVDEESDVIFILKGADSIMIPFMSNPENQQFIRETTEDLAKQGYRTLVFGSKTMSRAEYNRWQQRMNNAENEQMDMELGAENDKNNQVEELRYELENGLDFLCVTAVEDLLRDDVRSSIINFREAGIKVWMLTGDKLETAKCVSICTGFKSEKEEFLSITGLDPQEIQIQLNKLIGKNSEQSNTLGKNSNFYTNNYNNFQINPTITNEAQQLNPLRMSDSSGMIEQMGKIIIEDKCLLISGDTLAIILKNKTLKEIFLKKAPLANSVVLCRCAPKQKSIIASLLKNKLNKVVCSVGDGGNDVGMIQASSLGIGIEGREGRQASLASDISVIEFSHLQKLLFWHGRLSYLRTSKLCNFVIHRGIIVTVIQTLFILVYYFVSISIYNGLTLLGYSTVFTTLPIFMLILDKDLPQEQALNYPILYEYLQQGKSLNIRVFLNWLFQSIFQGAIVLLTAVIFYHEVSFSKIVTTTFFALLLIGKILLASSNFKNLSILL